MPKQISYEHMPWLRHYESGVPQEKDYETICLPEILARRVEEFPEAPALLFQGYEVTYRALDAAVRKTAAFLAHLGIKKGDRVALLLPNTIPCVIAFYATMRIGAIAVMNNPLYTDRELTYQFSDSGAETLITLDLLARRMIDLRPNTAIRHIIYTCLGDYLPFLKKLLFPLVAKRKNLAATVPKADHVYSWKQVSRHSLPDPAPLSLEFEDPALYQYTGGTTGRTKGAILTHGNLSMQVQQISAWFPGLEKAKEVMLGALPFFHVFGLSTSMNFAIYMAWANVLVPKPNPDTLIETIQTYRPTFVPMVPTMFIGILNHPDVHNTNMRSIKGCFSGSAPLPQEVIRAFEKETGAIIVEGYGLTESSPVSHINPFGNNRRKIGSIGLPISDTQCRIIDLQEGETEVPPGTPGELLIKGPQVMKGYLNKPEETAAALKDGWLHTGDIALMDEEGYFFIVDRKKDMIISSGYNVYPRDIEEVLFDHPKIKEAAAVGIPHPKRGEAIKVYVVLKDDAQATKAELMAYCTERLAKYKHPSDIEIREALPKSNIGKVLKRELRAEALGKTRTP
ncbi:MAG: long-chain fatty acid--CoA ligase [Desulfobacterales bacterium]|nr:long-chain fatty acid--CoA ligase [Desulfobacterales bacterium]